MTLNCRGPAIVLDPATGSVLQKRELFDGDVYGIAYVDGNRSLLVGGSDVHARTEMQIFGQDNRTLLVDAETLQPQGEPFDITAHNIFPIGDGTTAMVHEFSPEFDSVHWRVIDVSTGDVLSEGDVNLLPFVSVASPDSSTMAMAGDTGEIVTVDLSTGDEQRRSASLGAGVHWLNYSDDGELLVSGAADGAVSLWDATTLDLLGTVYAPHRGKPVTAGAQFIGDTHDVAIASHDGTVYRWETDLDRAIDLACQMAGRNLTHEEWEDFLPGQPYQSVCPDE